MYPHKKKNGIQVWETFYEWSFVYYPFKRTAMTIRWHRDSKNELVIDSWE